MQISQKDLEYIMSVKSNRSISKAARECCITQPALSNHIRRIEDKLGIMLFDRQKTSTELTSHGEHLMPFAEELLTDMHSLIDTVKALRDPFAFPLLMGIEPSLASSFVPALCGAMQTYSSKSRVVFTEGKIESLLEMLVKRTLDIGLISEHASHDASAFIPLFKEGFVLVCHKDAFNWISVVEDLRDLPINELILHKDIGYPTSLLSSLLNVDFIGSAIPSQITTTSIETICGYVECGIGCALLPDLSASRIVKANPALKCLPISIPGFTRRIGLAHRVNCSKRAVLPYVVDAVRHQAKTLSVKCTEAVLPLKSV